MTPEARTRAATFSAGAAAAGLAGTLLLTVVLGLDHWRTGPPGWEGPLTFDAERQECLPRHTFPIEPGRTASAELSWTGSAPAGLTLHVRDDDGRCLGERKVDLPPTSGGKAILIRIPLRASLSGPHTLVWISPAAQTGTLTLRVRPQAPLPFFPLAVTASAFAVVGVGGILGLMRGRAQRSRRAVAAGAALGIALALGALAAAARMDAPLTLLETGRVEEP